MGEIPEAMVERVARVILVRRCNPSWTTDDDWNGMREAWRESLMTDARAALEAAGVGELLEALRNALAAKLPGPVATAARSAIAKAEGRADG